MAKPGQGLPGHPPKGAVPDLGALREVPDELAARAQIEAEKQMGARCGGCGRRIRLGYRFTGFKVGISQGMPTVVGSVAAACSRDDCGFAQQARDQSAVVEQIEFAWLGPDPADRLPEPEPEEAPGSEEAG